MREPRLALARPRDATAILDVRDQAILGTAAQSYGPDLAADWASRRGPETPGELADLIGAGDELAVVARTAGEIVAFGSVALASGELVALYVLPAHGRQGIATRILAAIETRARRRGLSELHLNASLNAEAFYRRHGYAALGPGEHALPSGRSMTCVRMRKAL